MVNHHVAEPFLFQKNKNVIAKTKNTEQLYPKIHLLYQPTTLVKFKTDEMKTNAKKPTEYSSVDLFFFFIKAFLLVHIA